MEFPSAGILALQHGLSGRHSRREELVGSHGGVGGEQTDAFIFHPAEMDVPETRRSTDVFHILDSHRNAPVVAEPVSEDELVPDWAPCTLTNGIGVPAGGSALPCAA